MKSLIIVPALVVAMVLAYYSYQGMQSLNQKISAHAERLVD